jgi:rRNA maturation endonuclease Nob1
MREEDKVKVIPFSDWEPVISTEMGEKAQCDRCKKIVESSTIGEHIFCDYCNKYLWRKK